MVQLAPTIPAAPTPNTVPASTPQFTTVFVRPKQEATPLEEEAGAEPAKA